MIQGMGLASAAWKGAAASLAGGLAIHLVWRAGQRLAVPRQERVLSPTTEMVHKLASRSGRSVSEKQAQAAAGAVYAGTMIGYGALYGILQDRLRPPPLAHALLLAGIMYAANFPRFGILPRMDILPPPARQSTGEAAVPVVAQAAYAVTTAAVFGALARA